MTAHDSGQVVRSILDKIPVKYGSRQNLDK